MNEPAADLATALADLRDIHLPPDPAAAPFAFLAAGTPVALAWLAAAAFAFAAIVWLRQTRPRRRALRRLRGAALAYRADRDGQRFAACLARLLREQAQARHGDAIGGASGGASGEAWLGFLDAHGGDGAFSQGAGRALLSAPYQPPQALDAAQLEALRAAVENWLRKNS